MVGRRRPRWRFRDRKFRYWKLSVDQEKISSAGWGIWECDTVTVDEEMKRMRITVTMTTQQMPAEILRGKMRVAKREAKLKLMEGCLVTRIE